MWQRPVVIGLSPNLDFKDFLTALKTLFAVNTWKRGAAIIQVETWFKDYFQMSHAISFNAARSGLFAVLVSLGLEKGSEVLIQAFTCVAVPNSIIWAGLKPVYVDVDSSLNIDVSDAQNKLTPKCRVLIVQHTFGNPAEMENILQFCGVNNLILIEDCAHALGATYSGQKLGTFGKAAVFSFGRDKVISSVFGGIVVTKDASLGEKLQQYKNKITFPGYSWILQQLLHPLICATALVLYQITIGKVIIWLSQQLKLLSFPVYPDELTGGRPPIFPQKYPNALAKLLLVQLSKLEAMNAKRREIANEYSQKISGAFPYNRSGSIFLRFTIFHEKADAIRFFAKKKGIILGDWYKHVVDPKNTRLKSIGYREGDCPKAEKYALTSLNLPTYFTLSEFQRNLICEVINKHA